MKSSRMTLRTVLPTLLACAALVLIGLQAIPAAASSEGSFQRTLRVSGPVNLDISTGSGNVEVRTSSSNQVQVYTPPGVSLVEAIPAQVRVERFRP